MDKISDDEKAWQAVKAFILNISINTYAVERVAFGYEKPGDKAPIDLYLTHLSLGFDYEPQMRKNIPGIYIDEQECINAEFDYSEYVYDLFVCQMEKIFFNAPKDKHLERAGEELPLKPRPREYLLGIISVFGEVLKVKVEYDAFDIIPINKALYYAEYFKWLKFVTAILLKPLRSGSQINRYVMNITNAPYYINRLIEKNGKKYYLKQIDINSYEYIFALFSLMTFTNNESGKLLELKMREWERRNIYN